MCDKIFSTFYKCVKTFICLVEVITPWRLALEPWTGSILQATHELRYILGAAQFRSIEYLKTYLLLSLVLPWNPSPPGWTVDKTQVIEPLVGLPRQHYPQNVSL